jgi:lambda repressor-like predicted transcriptional regulator
MLGQSGFANEGVDFIKKSAHAPCIARFSVQVNARNNVSARHAFACHHSGMKEGWFERLEAAIKADGRSLNQLSEAAGLGRNFVQQMLKVKKQPGTDNVAKLLNVLGPSASFHVILGYDVEETDLELLEVISTIPRSARPSIVEMFRNLASGAAE